MVAVVTYGGVCRWRARTQHAQSILHPLYSVCLRSTAHRDSSSCCFVCGTLTHSIADFTPLCVDGSFVVARLARLSPNTHTTHQHHHRLDHTLWPVHSSESRRHRRRHGIDSEVGFRAWLLFSPCMLLCLFSLFCLCEAGESCVALLLAMCVVLFV
jgi:hypothetical protein